MKSFSEQLYHVTIRVLVVYGDDSWYDEIKGLNAGHALYLARLNWIGAEIKRLEEL